jgi:hypothetical protein
MTPFGGVAGFRNRKGVISQNVLIAVNFAMRVVYGLSGSEGCASDAAVLLKARQVGFAVPEGCYFLADAGYGLTRTCLTPYRVTRYHLREFAQMNYEVQNARELFTLRHSKLRSIVERVFGIVKKKFPILNFVRVRSLETQNLVIYSCFLIWNLIVELERDDFNDDDFWFGPEEPEEPIIPPFDDPEAEGWRDEIAIAMWEDYTIRRAEWRRTHPNAAR